VLDPLKKPLFVNSLLLVMGNAFNYNKVTVEIPSIRMCIFCCMFSFSLVLTYYIIIMLVWNFLRLHFGNWIHLYH